MQLQRTRLNVVSHKPLLWQQTFNHVHVPHLDFGTRGAFVLFPLYKESCSGEELRKHALRLENVLLVQPGVCSYNTKGISLLLSPQVGMLRWGATSSLREAEGVENTPLELDRTNSRIKLDLREICLYNLFRFFSSVHRPYFWNVPKSLFRWILDGIVRVGNSAETWNTYNVLTDS